MNEIFWGFSLAKFGRKYIIFKKSQDSMLDSSRQPTNILYKWMLEFFYFHIFNSQVWLNCLMGDCRGNVVEFYTKQNNNKIQNIPNFFVKKW
jgi:hypothetical protein